jgi:TetR/AcrR family transcriptional repressor of lmrAB and yxaGH operons
MAASLEATEFELGCPIATVALETAAASAPLADACSAGFARWLAAIAAGLERDGHPAGDAEDLAVLVLSSLEGALVLARAARDTDPIHRVAARLRPLLERTPPCDS